VQTDPNHSLTINCGTAAATNIILVERLSETTLRTASMIGNVRVVTADGIIALIPECVRTHDERKHWTTRDGYSSH
jgi:uncharacterized protein (UPF0333 family)